MADKATWVIVVLLVLIGAQLTGYDLIGKISPTSIKPAPTVAAPTVTAVTTTACPDSTVTMTVGKAQEKFNPAVDVTTENHRVFTKENGGIWVDQGLKKDGTTLSVKVGASVVVVYAENSTNAGTGSSNSGHYASIVKLNVPCGAFSTAEFDDPVKRESYLYDIHSTLASRATVRVFNTDDGDANTNINNQPLTTNDVKNLKIEIESSTEDAISPYGSMIVVIEGNKSIYDQFILNDASGKAYTSIGIPPQHVINNTNNKVYAYRVPGLISSQIVSGTLTVDTGGTYEINVTGDSNITINTYDENFYRDTNGAVNDGAGVFGDVLKGTTMFFGVADNDNNDVGADEDQGATPEFQIQVN